MEKQIQKAPKFSQALRRLPQQARVGCVAIAVERALEDYPIDIATKYHLDDAITAAWEFVRKGSSVAADDDRITDLISDELPNLDAAGYSYDHGLMAISLVLGFSRPPSLQAAVEYAGRVWALGPGASPEKKEQDPDGLKGPVYECLFEAIEACEASGAAKQWEKVIRKEDASPAATTKPAGTTKTATKTAQKSGAKKTAATTKQPRVTKKPAGTKTATKTVRRSGAKKTAAKKSLRTARGPLV